MDLSIKALLSVKILMADARNSVLYRYPSQDVLHKVNLYTLSLVISTVKVTATGPYTGSRYVERHVSNPNAL
jgi:hypothetical protein